MPVNYEIIGNRIQAKRRSKNFTQEQMAEHLDVTAGYISQIERGVTKINLDMLSSISEYLECDISDFILKSNQPAINFYEDDIFHDYQKLSPSERRMLSLLLRTYLNQK